MIEKRVAAIEAAARAELEEVLAQGGDRRRRSTRVGSSNAWSRSQSDRLRRIESGEQTVVGLNRFTETAPSPLATEGAAAILKVDEAAERQQVEALRAHRARRNAQDVAAALAGLRAAASGADNVMLASIRCAHAGVTTGEWAGTLREIFGSYRAPTGIAAAAAGSANGDSDPRLQKVRERVRQAAERIGHPLKVLIGKPGLDGHSNGAEQIAVACCDAGMEVIYGGIRLTPAEIVATARDEGVDLVGLSILSGSHLTLVPQILNGLRAEGVEDIPLVVGGIVPEEDAAFSARAASPASTRPRTTTCSRSSTTWSTWSCDAWLDPLPIRGIIQEPEETRDVPVERRRRCSARVQRTLEEGGRRGPGAWPRDDRQGSRDRRPSSAQRAAGLSRDRGPRRRDSGDLRDGSGQRRPVRRRVRDDLRRSGGGTRARPDRRAGGGLRRSREPRRPDRGLRRAGALRGAGRQGRAHRGPRS